MASGRQRGQVVNIVAGWACLVTATLNWWNMFGVGATPLRVALAGTITAIGLFLLIRGYRPGGTGKSGGSPPGHGDRT